MQQKFRKIFVPGVHGFVGQNVATALEKKGLPFAGLSLRDGYDFRNFAQTKALFEKEKFDAVINCASFVGGIQFGYAHPGEIFYNNSIMAANLMEAARLTGVKRFVNPISNCVYPARLERFREEELWDGDMHESVLAYAAVRKATWVQGWAYQRQYGFDSVHLVLPNMYGPHDHFEEVRSHALTALVMKFVEARRKNFPEVVVWGTGKPIREWLYVGDGADFLVKALDILPVTDPVNIGRGEGISIKALAAMIKSLAGYKGGVTFDTSKPDGAACKVMVVDKMKKVYTMEPRTPLEEGIRRTIEWYERSC
jgi:GDP-L-fucose synthase